MIKQNSDVEASPQTVSLGKCRISKLMVIKNIWRSRLDLGGVFWALRRSVRQATGSTYRHRLDRLRSPGFLY